MSKRMPGKFVSLSRKMSLALRHNPSKFGILLNDEGWTDIEDFLTAMEMTREDLDFIQANSDKKRFEVQDTRIKAYYGHSIKKKIRRMPVVPPDLLYHGTSPKTVCEIKRTGLRSMSRQHVHLSTDRDTAIKVGHRKHMKPVILTVHAAEANKKGIKFYHGNEDIWLSETVPPEFITSQYEE